MGNARHQFGIDEAFERIEESILPSMSMMLDTLLDAATLGRPGIDAEVYAAELRTIGLELETLIGQMESISASRYQNRPYRGISVA